MGTMAALLWDVLAKAANLAQMSGLHAVMLVAVGATLLRIPQSKRECAELERCARRLSALLQWPTTSSSGVALLCPDTMALIGVNKALGDAAGLVDSYKKSAMWCRLRRGRSMSRQLLDMQDVVNSYYCVVLYINAHLLILQAATHVVTHPTSDITMIEEEIDPSEGPGVQALTKCPTGARSSDTQRTNDIAQGGVVGSQKGNTEPAECERRVPDIV